MSEAERVAQAIERGETYEHPTHGPVKVLGLWKGMKRVDEAGNTDEDENGPMIVCYTIEADGQPVGELSDTVDEFLDAIGPDD